MIGNLSKFIYHARRFFLDPIGSLLAFALLFIMPVASFLFYLKNTSDKNYYSKYWMSHELSSIYNYYIYWALSICLVVVIIELNKSFFVRSISWIQEIIRPLMMGSLFGVVLSMLYMYIVLHIDFRQTNQIMAESMGIYLSCCGLFVAYHGIYKDRIPIVDIRTLLDSINDKLATCNARIIWSYPGLSFGSVTIGGERYKQFHDLMTGLIGNPNITKEFYILDKQEITSFYNPYDEINQGISDQAKKAEYTSKIKRARTDSTEFIDSVITQAVKRGTGAGMCKCTIVQHDFRFQAVIIDDVVFLLHPYGLPIKTSQGWKFTAPQHNSSPVDFLGTKVRNGAIANIVIEHIRNEAQQLGCEIT